MFKDTFIPPNFSTGDIELRVENDEVCIYVTDEGLKKMVSFFESIKEKNDCAHIHLEDYDVLTKNSMRGVIAKFCK